MTTLIETIPQQPSRAVASYNFIEFANNQGLANLYLSDTDSTFGTQATILTSNSSILSEIGYINVQDGGTAIDKDFDLTVLRPFNSGNLCYFNIPLLIVASGATSIGDDLTLTVRKVSGATETNLGSKVISITLASLGGGDHDYRLNGTISIPNHTHFKIGDKIRFTMAFGPVAHANTVTYFFGTDPADRGGTSLGLTSTQFINGARSTLLFPIKLDIL